MSVASEDTKQLRLLSIMYYVWASLTILFSCLGAAWLAMIYDAMGTADAQNGGGPPVPVRQFVTILGSVVFLIAFVLAGLSFWVGRCIASRRNHTFCLVIAGITCLSFPFGTALGVFTFVVLMRPSVRALFSFVPPSLPQTEHA